MAEDLDKPVSINKLWRVITESYRDNGKRNTYCLISMVSLIKVEWSIKRF